MRTGLQLLLLVAFGLKAAVFPLFFWLPDSYPTARSPVTAVFAGLLTKVGVYAMRPHPDPAVPRRAHSTLLLWVAGAARWSSACSARSPRTTSSGSCRSTSSARSATWCSASPSVGPAAIAATIFFLLHQIPVKTSLFLVDGMVEHAAGTSRLDRLGGLAHRSGLLAALFLLPALSLSGIPPFSGFVAKLGLRHRRVRQPARACSSRSAIVGSLLTLVSMTKIWMSAFWGEPAAMRPASVGAAAAPLRTRWPLGMTAPTVALVAVGLAIALFAGPLYGLCRGLPPS